MRHGVRLKILSRKEGRERRKEGGKEGKGKERRSRSDWRARDVAQWLEVKTMVEPVASRHRPWTQEKKV